MQRVSMRLELFESNEEQLEPLEQLELFGSLPAKLCLRQALFKR